MLNIVHIKVCFQFSGSPAAYVKNLAVPEEAACNLIKLPPVMSFQKQSCIVGDVVAGFEKHSSGLAVHSYNTVGPIMATFKNK